MALSDFATATRGGQVGRPGARPRNWFLGMLLVVLAMALGAVAGAAEAAECDGNAAAFEVEFQSYVADVRRLASEVEERGFLVDVSLRDLADETEAAAKVLTPEQKEALCEFFETHPTIRQAPGNLYASLRQLPENQGIGLMGMAPDMSMMGPPSCMAPGGRGAAIVVAVIAELANSLADMFCDASPSGDITAVNVVVCIITGVTGAAAILSNAIVTADDECNDQLDSYESDLAQQTTQANFDEVNSQLDVVEGKVDTLARQTAVETVSMQVEGVGEGVDDLDSELDTIGADLGEQKADREEFQDLSLRISIEQLLGSDLNDRVSLFQLPEAFGGKLEMVREVVAAAILMNDDAGKTIDQALLLFAQGDSHFNSQEYSLAFSSYRQAYRAAVQADEAPGQGVRK